MRIIPQKRFLKRLIKLSPKIRERVKIAVDLLEIDPFDTRLHNHPLNGTLAGLRSISVTTDVRIIFQEFFHYKIVLFLDIGTHNQVY